MANEVGKLLSKQPSILRSERVDTDVLSWDSWMARADKKKKELTQADEEKDRVRKMLLDPDSATGGNLLQSLLTEAAATRQPQDAPETVVAPQSSPPRTAEPASLPASFAGMTASMSASPPVHPQRGRQQSRTPRGSPTSSPDSGPRANSRASTGGAPTARRSSPPTAAVKAETALDQTGGAPESGVSYKHATSQASAQRDMLRIQKGNAGEDDRVMKPVRPPYSIISSTYEILFSIESRLEYWYY